MNTRKSILWIVTTTLAALLASVIWRMQAEPTLPQPTPEPDLFSFLKPLGNIAPAGGEPAEAVQSDSPRDTQDNRLSPQNVFNTEQAIHQMRANGASDDELYRARAASMSAQAAAQLADAERAQTAWDHRVHAYLAERDKVLNVHADTLDVKTQQALQALRNAHFTFEEQTLLAAYESFPMPHLTLP